MRTTADLNRIIDKIAETNPVRLNTSTTARDEFQSRKEKETETTPRQFVPRLAADADSLASTAPTASGRPSARRVKTEKNSKELKAANIDAATTTAKQRDDETKRTQRRRQIDPTTCERDYSTDEIEFMKALDDYKRASGRMFPTCSEILEVFKSLGYVKIARAETTEKSTPPNDKPNRAATPAFLNDEENGAFEFNNAPIPGVA
ncbi:MAG: hypothetical protein IJ991_08885 [Thermoguttaceae bacterium]|nr:hypothetical protein [Thermoguttaceae bacterium]